MIALTTTLLNYFANALWQAPLLFGVAWLLARTIKRLGPAAEHRLWVTALFAQLIVPALNVPIADIAGVFRYILYRLHPAHAVYVTGNVVVTTGPGYVAHGTAPPVRTLYAGMAACLLLIAFFALRLGIRLLRTHLLLHRAQQLTPAGTTLTLWQRLSRVFAVTDAQLATSADITGPVTLGIHQRWLIVPPTFTTGLTAEDQEAALAHECAHMQRRDYARNLAYEILSLPLAWHPVRHRTLAHIAETREMVCDAMAADALAGRERYARSLLRLAAALLATQPTISHHAIGIFDANTLERRIMNLKQKRPTLLRARRTAIACAILIACATCASALALRLHLTLPAVHAAATTAHKITTPQPPAATVAVASKPFEAIDKPAPEKAVTPALETSATPAPAKQPEPAADAPTASIELPAQAQLPPPPIKGDLQDSPIRVPSDFAASHIELKVNPQYPQEARDKRISGIVLLHAVIGRDGAIKTLEFISGPDELRDSALTAVRQWVYKPYLLNGQPTEVDTTITVHYNLSSS